MDCAGVATHLVGYHFATLAGEERDAVAAHLLGCRACLEAYLALKHAAEADPLARPSAEARARLRGAVAVAFGDKASRSSRRPPPPVPLLARRIPLYQGALAAAVAAAVTLAAPSVVERVFTRSVHEGAPALDTSRPRAESLQIY